MGYKVMGTPEHVYRNHGPRKGLEGPFAMRNGRILYYDTKEGQYWDPSTDFYVSHEEALDIHSGLL